ncbi:MAG: hypothetical protein Q9163_002206 [Psora crenata]
MTPPMTFGQRSSPTAPPDRSLHSPSSSNGQSPTSPMDGRGMPPPRPPRPQYPYSTLHSPSDGYRPPSNYWEGGHDSFSSYSSSSRPSTTATGSSTVSIPDFPTIPPSSRSPPMPTPTHPPPPRRNLGPPPSARRGVPSYYSQNWFVPPIPEERSESHSSYASSHVMPESWGDGPPTDYVSGGIDEGYEEELDSGQRSGTSSGRHSKASDYSEHSTLVRAHPRTKPLRPFMDTIESGDESDRSRGSRGMGELDWQPSHDATFRPGFGGAGGRRGSQGTDAIGRNNFKVRGGLQQPYSGYESDATFLESPRSASPSTQNALRAHNTSSQYVGTPTSRGSPVDPRVGQILGNLEKGGALPSSGTVTPRGSATPSINEPGARRPAPLPREGSKAPSSTGSASSLPELIRRATRLASNLDRGKTVSRIGVLDLLDKKEMEKQVEGEKGSRHGSITDMLAAFPSPSLTASTGPWGAASPRGKSNLSRAQTVTYGSTKSHRKHRGRRIFGLPVWAMFLLSIILLLFVAAAVVIPVTLVVLPRENGQSLAIDSCRRTAPCANGGSSILVDESCRCICVRGFTGSTCDAAPDVGCKTFNISVPGTNISYTDATLGSSIPRIISAASMNYSIPLSGATLAALFSYTNLSCASENALVTFNQKSEERRSLAEALLSPLPIEEQQLLWAGSSTPMSLTDVPSPSASRPIPPSHVLNARASAQSSNGIVFAADGGSLAPDDNTAPPDATAPAPTSSSSPASAPTGSSRTVTPTVRDFARTAILFIFQVTGNLSAATTAMNRLQTLFSDGNTFDASQTSAGGNITVDLSALTVGFGNGTLYGGKGS